MLIDTIIAMRCASHINSLPPPPPCPSFMECSLNHRSTTDVVFAGRLAVEKGFDLKGEAAIPAADIVRFYDGIAFLAAAEHLTEEGLADCTAVAFVRLHICVGIEFDVQGCLLSFPRRAGAVLTGTRTSVVGGRIVTRDVGRQCASDVSHKGFKLGDFRCAATKFVDNFYALAHTPPDAISIMQRFEVRPHKPWG